jgi:hypothetical protein
VDQARSRSGGRHDGSHRLRRNALRRSTDSRGSRKRAPRSFQGASHSPRYRRRRGIPPMELLVPSVSRRESRPPSGAPA